MSPVVVSHVVAPIEHRDPGIAALGAAIVGLILPGIMHFYVGKLGRGIAVLVIGILLKAAFFVIVPMSIILLGFSQIANTAAGGLLVAVVAIGLANLGFWAWQICDVYALAKKYNEGIDLTGEPRW
jgi:tetrahydromethanopterin S-methyltransferase subunit C